MSVTARVFFQGLVTDQHFEDSYVASHYSLNGREHINSVRVWLAGSEDPFEPMNVREDITLRDRNLGRTERLAVVADSDELSVYKTGPNGVGYIMLLKIPRTHMCAVLITKYDAAAPPSSATTYDLFRGGA